MLVEFYREIAQTTSVTSLLANPNITLTPRDKSKDSTPSDSTPPPSLPVTENITSRPVRPETVDLTVETHTSQSILTQNLTCQVCDKTFNSAKVLKAHLKLHLKRSIPGYNRINSSAGSISNHNRLSSDTPLSGLPQPASNPHPPEAVSSSNEINRTVSTDPNLTVLGARLLDPLAAASIECTQGPPKSNPVPITSKQPTSSPPAPSVPFVPPVPPAPSVPPATPVSPTSCQENGTGELFIPIIDVSKAGVLSQLVIHFKYCRLIKY